jgi:aldehyde dehydrogenase family 7 protein A1
MISRLVSLRTKKVLSHHASRLLARHNAVRCISTFDKHREVFDAFGLEKSNNKGVFDGEWKGSGKIVPSINPVNNEVIAEVVQVK